jgi:hypothetical protein
MVRRLRLRCAIFFTAGSRRLIPASGLKIDLGLGLPEKLLAVQHAMAAGDERAEAIYETIGVYLGYTIAHYAEFYSFRNLLLLGRVTTGAGGGLIVRRAEAVLREEFPELAIRIHMPDEKEKRHGQAMAAASLPVTTPAGITPSRERANDMNPYQTFVAQYAQTLAQGAKLPLGEQAAPQHKPLPANAPKALIFSPHPDDEVIIGGLPLRLRREMDMNVINVAVTQGSNKARQAERWKELGRLLRLRWLRACRHARERPGRREHENARARTRAVG